MKKYSKDKCVVFDNEYHTYHLNGKRLTSVSKLIRSYKNEFDSDKMAEKTAKKLGITKQEVLNRWKQKADLSRKTGNIIHSALEKYVLIKQFTNNEEYSKLNTLNSFINDMFESNRLIPIETEYIVYNDFFAHQIDLICKDSDNNVFIFDLKTNEEITSKSYGKSMKNELYLLEDSTLIEYYLILNIDKILIKDFKIKDMYLIHLKESNYEFIKVPELDSKQLDIIRKILSKPLLP
jgi:hypothetical protein